jgi:hypothetical protein
VTFRAATSRESTSSTAFSNIPDAGVNFTVGGDDPTCVVVVFSAEAQTGLDRNMAVRARLLSGIGVGEPPQVFFGRHADVGLHTRSMQFVFPEVPPGNQSLRIQFRSTGPGDVVRIGARTTVVHHR